MRLEMMKQIVSDFARFCDQPAERRGRSFAALHKEVPVKLSVMLWTTTAPSPVLEAIVADARSCTAHRTSNKPSDNPERSLYGRRTRPPHCGSTPWQVGASADRRVPRRPRLRSGQARRSAGN